MRVVSECFGMISGHFLDLYGKFPKSIYTFFILGTLKVLKGTFEGTKKNTDPWISIILLRPRTFQQHIIVLIVGLLLHVS